MEQHLSQYRIFYEVAKTGNISRAAKELYISQPAISKAVSKLEESLDVVLFVRNSRGVTLTPEGQMLFEHVSRAFEDIFTGEQQLKRIREFQMGQIRIGVSNTLCKYILLPYLKSFIRSYPHVKIIMKSQSTVHTVDQLENGLLDLGLIALPSNKKSLSFHPVMDIQDTFVATPEYLKNLKLREGKDCSLFSSGSIMLLDKTNMTRRYIDDYLLENHIETNELLEVTTMDLLIEFSKIGLGIGCVIREFVRDELQNGSLVEIPPEPPLKKRTIGFSYSGSNPNPMLKTFLENGKSGQH